ncbi:MAG: tetratricopeptide repeat protein, partial [Anaerolineaceae bacterium]
MAARGQFMPETINLRDYLEYIDNLLEERQPNEAAFHSRHIIGQRPKDIGAYRRMGRALIALDQWDEAGEVLRRVLSVVPDDQRAHLGLSRAYHYTRKPAQAIWHLERAWEHDPNNTTLSDELRQMYFVHHKVEDARLQLTTGAVARQYVRNGLYDQAINLLANTLKQAPDRVDLRLLLALTQREAGQHIKAAETALDIISVLPDCLSANRILAELWLMEGRPSDAQRYLSRIEAVDPYLAVRLAGGEDADPNLFQVMYGDYEQSAMREMADVQPDWLSDLDDDATLLRDDDESDSMLAVSDADDDPFADIVEPEEADDDPFADLMAMDDDDADDDPFADIVEPEEAVSSGGDDDDDWWSSASDDEWFSDANERAGQMTGELNADFDSVMADLESEKTIRKPTQGLTGLLSLLDDDSALADESRPVETTSADDDGDDAHGEDDPFAGVADGDDDLPDWLTPEGDAEEPAAPEAPASDPDDPFAWMRDSGIEVDEDADVRRMSSEALEDDDPAEYAGSSGQTDPLAWLKDSGVELDEEDDDAVMAAEAGEDKPATDPLSWLKDSGVEMDDGDDFADGDELDDVTLQLGEDDEADDELIFDDEGLLDEAQAIEDLLAADSTATEGEADMSDRDADDFNWLDDDGDDESGVEAEPDWLASMADDDGDDETTDEDLTADDSADDDEGDFEALYALEPEEEDNDSLDLLAEDGDVDGIVPGPRTADDMPD